MWKEVLSHKMVRPDIFYSHGLEIAIPSDFNEPEEVWAERIAFILEYVFTHPDLEDLEPVILMSRQHINRLILGVKYI